MVGIVRFGAGLGLVGLMVVGEGPASLAVAESFHLKDGRVVEGSVLKGTLNTLTLRVGNSIELKSLSQIELVSFELADGREISGRLLGWKDGVFEIDVAGEFLEIADGQLLNDPSVADATLVATAESEPSSVDSIDMKSSPTFVFADGNSVVGKILHATGSVVTIQPIGLTPSPKSKAQIKQISFDGADGTLFSGQFIDWDQGTYQVQVDDRIVVANLSEEASKDLPEPSSPASVESTSAAMNESMAEPSETAELIEMAEHAADDAGTDADSEALLVKETAPVIENGAGGPANETAIAALSNEGSGESPALAAEDDDNDVHRINALVEAVDEGDEVAIFKFELNKPAARPLLVLYAATEASAKAGQDFESKSGVITFSTGSAYAEVEVPIIDDDEGEESETFNLFLSGDPKSVTFGSRQVAATINDND